MAHEAIYVKVGAESRRQAVQLVKSLLSRDRSTRDHKVFDYLSEGPEVVSEEKFEEVRLKENEVARKRVTTLIGQLQAIGNYLNQEGKTFRDEEIRMDLEAFLFDARFLRPDHVSAPERMTFDFEETLEQEGEVFYVRAMRHY